MALSGPMIASTFWKNTIPLCTGCDQSTACSSLWWWAKLPAVGKNFFGTIGARNRTSASGSRSPVSPAWPPRSNHSRVEAQSSSTTTSSSSRPTRPASKVTSFMTLTRSRYTKVAFVYHWGTAGAVSSRGLLRPLGGVARSRDPEHAELQGERRVVADQGEQLEQPGRADLADRLAVLGVVEVAAGDQRGDRARDHGLAPGQRLVAALAHGRQLGPAQADRAADRLVRVLREGGPPVRGDHQDRDPPAPVVEPGVVAHRGAERLQRRPQPRLQQEGVERAFETPRGVGQPEQLRALGAAAAGDRVVERTLVVVQRRGVELGDAGLEPGDARAGGHSVPALVWGSRPEISAQVASTAGRSSRMIRWVDQSRAWTATLTPATTRPSGLVIGPATDRR